LYICDYMYFSNNHIIHKKLKSFYKKFYLNQLYKGISLFVFFAFFYMLIAGLLEYFLWLAPEQRKALFYISIFVLFILFLSFLISPLLNLLGLINNLKKEQAARIIGQHFPEINDKLLNLIQLEKANQASDLLLASIDQKVRNLQPYNFTQAIDLKKNKKYFFLLLFPFLFVFLIKLSGKEKELKGSYQRLFSYNTSYEPPAPFSVQLLSPSYFMEGDDYTLKLKLQGTQIPTELFLTDKTKKLPLYSDNKNIFTLPILRPTSSFSFFITTGKYKFGPYHIQINYPPVISNTQLILTYPDYLHLPTKKLSELSNLSVPEGTKLQWIIRTKHIDTLVFLLDAKEKYLAVNNKHTSFKHQADRSFSYNFFPKNASSSNHYLTYNVHVIKDKTPQIKVEEKVDSLALINHYRIQASDDYLINRLEIHYKRVSDESYKTKPLPIKKSDFIQTYFRFPIDIPIDSISGSYEFYFKVFDSKSPHKQSIRSRSFYYGYVTKNQLDSMVLHKQASLINDLDKQKNRLQKQNLSIDKLKSKLTSQNKLDWQTQRNLNQFLNQQQKQEQFFKNSISKFRKILSKSKDDKALQKKELQKRLEELANLKKKEKLLNELQKLAKKLNKEKLLKAMKELKNYSRHQEKSLERMLELTKKYYIRQKLNRLSQTLSELSKQQQTLSEKDSDSLTDQKQVSNKFSDLKKQLDSISKMNKSLQTPLKLSDLDSDANEIKQDLQKAEKQLSQNQNNSANKTQKQASNKMGALANKMKSAMAGGGSQHSEDIATLQELLKGLLQFSFKQESLLNQFNSGSIRQHLANHLLDQNNQKLYFKTINDSIYRLALRNPRITQKVLDLSYNIQTELDLTLDNLAQLNPYSGAQHAQFVLTYANTLADMMSRALDSEKNASASKGSGKGKKKGDSFSLPDIIKKQGQSLKQMQQSLSKKHTEQGKKPGKQGQQPKEDDSQAQYELFKRQQYIKDALSQLKDKMTSPGLKQKLNKILKQMEELNKRLLREGITSQNFEILKHLQEELLKLKNATYKQHMEEKRESRTNNINYSSPDSLFIEKNTNFAPSIEFLKRTQIPVNQTIKQKIIDFINHD